MADTNIGNKTYVSRNAVGNLWREVISFTVTSAASGSSVQTRLRKVKYMFLRSQSAEKDDYLLAAPNINATLGAENGSVGISAWNGGSGGVKWILEVWGN